MPGASHLLVYPGYLSAHLHAYVPYVGVYAHGPRARVYGTCTHICTSGGDRVLPLSSPTDPICLLLACVRAAVMLCKAMMYTGKCHCWITSATTRRTGAPADRSRYGCLMLVLARRQPRPFMIQIATTGRPMMSSTWQRRCSSGGHLETKKYARLCLTYRQCGPRNRQAARPMNASTPHPRGRPACTPAFVKL